MATRHSVMDLATSQVLLLWTPSRNSAHLVNFKETRSSGAVDSRTFLIRLAIMEVRAADFARPVFC